MKNIFLNKDTWFSVFKIIDNQIPDTMILYGSWFFQKIIPLMEKYISKEQDTSLPNIFIGKVNGKKIIYGCVYGPTMIGEMVHAAGVLGISKIILIGTCGGLNDDKSNVLIPNLAEGLDSVSSFYVGEKNKIKSDEVMLKKTEKILTEKKISFEVNKVTTLSSMLMEDSDLLERTRKENSAGIDLETATVYSIASYFKISAIAILVKSEKFIDDKVIPLEKEEKIKLRDELISCATLLV